MKCLLAFVFTAFITSLAIAGQYSLIDKQHTVDGCTYYDVSVWDDNGTPGDHSDDHRVAQGTINDCTDIPGMVPPSGDNKGVGAIIDERNPIDEPPCIAYTVSVINQYGEAVATDILFDCKE